MGRGEIFLKNPVKESMRDPRSWNRFGRRFLVDEIREYILKTGSLIWDIEDKLDGRAELESEPKIDC